MKLPKFVHGLCEDCDPRLAGEADMEWQARIEAARVTAEWRVPITTMAPQESIEDLPLFGGPRQQEMF